MIANSKYEEILSGLNTAVNRLPIVMDCEGTPFVVGQIAWRQVVAVEPDQYHITVYVDDMEPGALERLIGRYSSADSTTFTCGKLTIQGTVIDFKRKHILAGSFDGLMIPPAEQFVQFVVKPDKQPGPFPRPVIALT